MEITVQAVYEDGVLKPRTRLDLPDHAEVRVIICSIDGGSLADRTSGLLRVDLPPEVVREIGRTTALYADDEDEGAVED